AAGPHKAVLLRSACGQCNHGKARPAGHSANHAQWHGPYSTLAEARQVTQTLPSGLIRRECNCISLPFSVLGSWFFYLSNSVILSGVRTSRSEVLTESKDLLRLD